MTPFSHTRNHPHHTASQLLLGANFIFLILLALCVYLRPESIKANDGISYFASFSDTVIPYLVAYFFSSLFYFFAGYVLRFSKDTESKVFAWSFQIFSLLMLGLAATPHTVLIRTHVFFGSMLFSLQLILSLWIVTVQTRKLLQVALFLLQLGAGIFSAYYLPKEQGSMLVSQVVFQTAFVLMVFLSLRHAPHRVKAAR